ncbi:Katanin p80 WD40 repeat-containing subunit B1 like [Apostasia shenzhenica]|uniref:Katanin p80 WD40 repeat-containing subunit B1 like n=1 Tax=Apostasia shenzhenica TaxID=1088818 RepID=A0A2I0ACF2_9ASPA|nr:Katanin p80 WD40 repeat-containing subunit B1 like [Apostasia shenzhenica]
MTRNFAAEETAPAEDEEFYESLDRLLSSSCSSTSASDDDADHYHRRHRFQPPAAEAYEVWITEPGPVEERRRRLLQMMGLTGDPALARAKSPLWDGEGGEVARSISYKALYRRIDPFSSAALFARSRSDSAVDHGGVYRHHPLAPSFAPSEPIHPLSVQRFMPFDGGEKKESAVTDDGDDLCCTIRNLDTGKEFVVKEIREDGMWNKLREVETGRQLTMEEFEMCVGRSPIVQELMRRQINESVARTAASGGVVHCAGSSMGARSKKRGNWLKNLKNIAGTVIQYREKRSSDERDSSSEKGGRRSSSATDDSQDGSQCYFHVAERIRVRQYGKSFKELTGLYMTQEIQAHAGSIWSIKFSFDGRYLASAGEDCVIHVWQVEEFGRKGNLTTESLTGENGNCTTTTAAASNVSPELAFEANHWEKKRGSKIYSGRKSVSLENVVVQENLFALEEKPLCSFTGHLDDVLDLCWSKSEFNPVDDRYFISGSLDQKIRIWSIPDRRVVDWDDLHEMVTAACYTPDGQGALVGSHKGSCCLFDTSDNKLHLRTQIDLQNKKKKSKHKKITGFQFAPESNSEVLITSADSRIRIVDGIELVHKLKGYRNKSSQISASLTTNGKHVVCASEDSHVYVWRRSCDSHPSRDKGNNITSTKSHEHFHCRDVTVAIPWPSPSHGNHGGFHHLLNKTLKTSETNCHGSIDRASATWPEEKLPLASSCQSSPRRGSDASTNGGIHLQSKSAWGMVIVTAGRGGLIRAFQNFGLPVRV